MPIRQQYSIYDVIRSCSQRPGMYIGEPSPEKLYVMLGGYQLAMEQAGVADISQPPLHGFHDWVAAVFGFYESTAGWANMILAVTLGMDPQRIHWEDYDRRATPRQLADATQRCFELLEKYQNGVQITAE